MTTKLACLVIGFYMFKQAIRPAAYAFPSVSESGAQRRNHLMKAYNL
jgi:hypothetical protein